MQKISRKRFEWLKQKHYELWDWLSKNPNGSKDDWFELDKNRGLNIASNCFACEFAWEIKDKNSIESICNYCPLYKRDADSWCLNGLFAAYQENKINYVLGEPLSRTKIIELAKQIRDLPWSEEYVEDKEMNNENYIVINGKKTELTEEQLKQFGIEDEKNKRWRGEKEQKYFYVDTYNHVTHIKDYNTKQDKYQYDMHNYFKTYEEACEYAEVLETKRQLMKFADEHNKPMDWDNSHQAKHYLLYHPDNINKIAKSFTWGRKYAETIYFSSEQLVQQAIDTIGKENIVKYLTYNY